MKRLLAGRWKGQSPSQCHSWADNRLTLTDGRGGGCGGGGGSGGSGCGGGGGGGGGIVVVGTSGEGSWVAEDNIHSDGQGDPESPSLSCHRWSSSHLVHGQEPEVTLIFTLLPGLRRHHDKTKPRGVGDTRAIFSNQIH